MKKWVAFLLACAMILSAAVALKPDEAKLAQEKQDTLDHFDRLFK